MGLDQPVESDPELLDKLLSLRFGHGLKVHDLKEFIAELDLDLPKSFGGIFTEVQRRWVF
jgi:hypothetical protein